MFLDKAVGEIVTFFDNVTLSTNCYFALKALSRGPRWYLGNPGSSQVLGSIFLQATCQLIKMNLAIL